jgi:hypothetical protein
MEPFYNSWKASSHSNIKCVECHFEPGLEGKIKGKMNGLVQIVNYISTSYKKRKPWADIPDNTCSRADCHVNQAYKDTIYTTKKGVLFNHKHHLDELRRGKKLKCTSCHSQIVQGSHMQVTYATCFNCHFHKSPDPEHKYDKLSKCSTCHDLKSKTPEELSLMKYNHNMVVKNDIECASCHTNVINGKGEVGKERCFQCHFEDNKLDKYEDTEFMHKTHIAKHSMNCMYCHSPIKHKVEPMDPNEPPDCQSCHSGAHSSQVSLFSGSNGFNVEKTPSSMYLSGINCKGCHTLHEVTKGVNIDKSQPEACEKCHGKGYGNLIKQWEQSTIKRLAIVKSIYNNVNSIISYSTNTQKNEALTKLEQADHNIKIVDIGKGVHNIQFADNLLVAAYGLMKDALTIIGSNKVLPEFKPNTSFIPNECYNCHAGIQEVTKNVFGLNFSHKIHIVQNGLQCGRCHSNDEKHGKLLISKTGCNSCHHNSAASSETCVKCHSTVSQVYSGTIFGKNQPDIMKQGGAKCIDCHSVSSNIIKPDSKVCVKCHDAGYESIFSDWKKETNNLVKESENLINESKKMDLSDEQKTAVSDLRKLISFINSNSSLFVHNNDLINSLFSEKMKILKK